MICFTRGWTQDRNIIHRKYYSRAGRLPVTSVGLGYLGILCPGFMAKEKCDAFKCKKLVLDRSEEKEEDYDCLKDHGGWETLLSLNKILITGKG